MTTFTDNLNGTAGDLLSARPGWGRPIGVDNVAIITGGSGVALPSGATIGSSTWHVPASQPSGNDQFVEGYLGPTLNAFPWGLRCDPSTTTGGGYLARLTPSNVFEVYRRSASGVLLLVGSYTVPTPSDLLTNKGRFEVIGNSLTITFKGAVVVGPVTRTDFASGSVAMLSRGGTASTTAYTVDDWGSGDIGASAIAGSVSGTIGFTGASAATVRASGAAGSTVGFTGAATAAVRVQGSSTGAIAFTGAAAGSLAVTGAATSTIAFAGAASGSVVAASVIAGTAEGAIGFAGSATAVVAVRAAASATISFDGAAAGNLAITAGAAGLIGITGSASGTVASTAAGATISGTIDFTGLAAGKVAVAASASIAFDIEGAAAASAQIAGSVSNVLPFTGLSSGIVGAVPTGLVRAPTVSRPAYAGAIRRPANRNTLNRPAAVSRNY